MIRNERQYRITKSQADKFARAIEELTSAPEKAKIHPALRKAQIDALQSQLDDLRGELQDYERLKSGRRRVLELESFEDLPRALIQARIAAGLSQEELASKLGIKAQQVQRYEATEYQSASFARIAEVIRVLGIEVREDVVLPAAEASSGRSRHPR